MTQQTMRPADKKVVDGAAAVLNRHVAEGTAIGKIMAAGGEASAQVTDLVNDILKEVAGGARLVTAVETSGELLGFVPRSQVPIPEPAREEREVVPPSPDA